MKKLLSIALCAAAITSFAADEAVQIADVGVLSVTIPANQTNTIIAASFKNLSDSTKDVSIADMIKTTNLAAGDKLLLFTGTKGTYTAWVLNSDGKWAAAEKTYTVNANGELVEGTGTSASTTVTAGTGLWIVRESNTANSAAIAIYGAYTTDAKSTTTTAGAWNLIGNPGLVSKTISTGTKGDYIIRIVDGKQRKYMYNAKKTAWYYQTKAVVNNKVKTTSTYGAPTIEPGEGFWYYTQSAVTIDWADEVKSSAE